MFLDTEMGRQSEAEFVQRRPTRDLRRKWQPMLSGNRLDLFSPSPLDVDIEDIAQGLSRLARWNGQTQGEWAFSVAQHSLLVEEIFARLRPCYDRSWLLAALLHDAAEYVLGDLVTPYKTAVGPGYKDLEQRVDAVVHLRFGLPASLPAAVSKDIKRADNAAAYFEATQLANFGEEEARLIFGGPTDEIRPLLVPLSPKDAKLAFIMRYKTLSQDLRGSGDTPATVTVA